MVIHAPKGLVDYSDYYLWGGGGGGGGAANLLGDIFKVNWLLGVIFK